MSRYKNEDSGDSGFIKGMSYVGGVVVALVAVLLTLGTIGAGVAGFYWLKARSAQQAAEAEQAATLEQVRMIVVARRAEEEAEQERQKARDNEQYRAEAAAQAKRAADMESARLAADREKARLSLEALKARAEADKVRVEAHEREAARIRAEAEKRAAEYQRERDAREARRLARETALRKPMTVTLEKLCDRWKELEGQTITMMAFGTLKVFAAGHATVTFVDGKRTVTATVEKGDIDPALKVTAGVYDAVLTVSAVVGGSGAMRLRECRVIGVK